LFWKKSKPAEELFTYESCNFRSSYRVYPSEDNPIYMIVDGAEVEVVDIGAGGISFVNSNYKLGEVLSALITLPIRDIQVEAEINIVRISDEGTAHCAFKKINSEDSELIHKYMLQKQKQELRDKRKNKGLETEE